MTGARRPVIGIGTLLSAMLLFSAALWFRRRKHRRDSDPVPAARRSRAPGPLARGLLMLVLVAVGLPTAIAAVSIPAVVSATRADADATEVHPDAAAVMPDAGDPAPESEELPEPAPDWGAVAREVEELGAQAQTRIGAVVVDLESGERLLDVGGGLVFTTASVYKLHKAYAILSRVEAGELAPDATIGGLSVHDCLESAIVRSENECTEAFIVSIGLDAHLAAAVATGAAQTVNEPFDMRSSPDDFAVYLSRLARGELLNEEHTAMLLDMMRRQVWREGIPAAVDSAVGPAGSVADKVGWLDGVRNDAGIVTIDGRSYAVVIFTESDDWTLVREIASRIVSAL
jgi:beta-lactamase class A